MEREIVSHPIIPLQTQGLNTFNCKWYSFKNNNLTSFKLNANFFVFTVALGLRFLSVADTSAGRQAAWGSRRWTYAAWKPTDGFPGLKKKKKKKNIERGLQCLVK